jgi:hypothetical protein
VSESNLSGIDEADDGVDEVYETVLIDIYSYVFIYIIYLYLRAVVVPDMALCCVCSFFFCLCIENFTALVMRHCLIV